MIKTQLFLLYLFINLMTFSQTEKTQFINDVNLFRQDLNNYYKDKKSSPLEPKERRKFKQHEYYEINSIYKVDAKFKRTIDSEDFEMKTTTDRRPIYRKYGELSFSINDTTYTLSVYQNVKFSTKPEYKDDLFLLFTDETNGHGSYYGGRYIDLKIPEGNSISVDFNKSYNPYCHYNGRYSCPIPPSENHLKTKILAGIKSYNLKSRKHNH